MDTNYMLACGIVWRKTADPEAGWELIDGLRSADPAVRIVARALLLEHTSDSMLLLECALATGELSPEAAGPCMAEIIRGQRAKQTLAPPSARDLFNAGLC